MGRLGVVAAAPRTWRPYVGPVAFLLAVTLVVAIVRNGMHHGSTTKPRPAAVHKQKAAPKRRTHSVYVVHAGDTITAIAAKTGVPAVRLLKLNPKVSPTALYIGEKIRLR